MGAWNLPRRSQTLRTILGRASVDWPRLPLRGLRFYHPIERCTSDGYLAFEPGHGAIRSCYAAFVPTTPTAVTGLHIRRCISDRSVSPRKKRALSNRSKASELQLSICAKSCAGDSEAGTIPARSRRAARRIDRATAGSATTHNSRAGCSSKAKLHGWLKHGGLLNYDNVLHHCASPVLSVVPGQLGNRQEPKAENQMPKQILLVERQRPCRRGSPDRLRQGGTHQIIAGFGAPMKRWPAAKAPDPICAGRLTLALAGEKMAAA